MKRIYVVLKEDIVHFPPVQSILAVLASLGSKVFHLGTFSDLQNRKVLSDMGVTFVNMPSYDGKANIINKYLSQQKFRSKVESFLDNENLSDNDMVWLVQIETIMLLYKLVNKYKTVLHPLEYTDPNIGWKYKLISPGINLSEVFNRATKVVCCEYNRAHITKGVFNLPLLPFILPNKPYDFVGNNDVPSDIKKMIDEFRQKTSSKKIILYQGIFLDKERRLEEFCEAISLLPKEYVLVAMGAGSEMYDNLKNKYQGDRIIFIPFIKPPFHLEITRTAHIGVLSYFPRPYNIGSVINPIYCAPNKIYEYAKYGKPMLSNDIPGLHYIFTQYHCGECVNYPMTPHSIAKAIERIDLDYESYSNGVS